MTILILHVTKENGFWLTNKPVKNTTQKPTFFKKHRIKLLLLGVLVVVWFFCLPKPLFKDPTATVVFSRENELIGARIAADGQWRFPEMDSIPYRFEESILQFEDAHFYTHPGFNPVAMSKALWDNLTTSNRRGASTITQQVIRLSRKNKTRSYGEKLIELFLATRLEAGTSKKEILMDYASHAPFGGNVVGLETASWRYFGIPASQLSWGQATALAVLPNAPALIFPGKNETILKEKRDRLLQKLLNKKIIDTTTFELAIAERLPGKPVLLPNMAPHFTERLRAEHPGEKLQTTLDYQLQNQLNALAKQHYQKLLDNEVHNLAILVLDVNTREVLGYVGNAPTTRQHGNYVDVITKPRSTGSVLKPLLYASMLGAGDLLPNTLIADVPTTINGYSPENFNKNYSGAVPASEAISRSLNIPAVRMLRSYGLERFYRRLQEMHMDHINKPPSYYGLALILGGAESSLWEITNTYAGLASTLNYFGQSSSTYHANAFAQPVYQRNISIDLGETVAEPTALDAGSIYYAFEAMRQVNRPVEETNWNFFNGSQAIAWKTGTSFGFKDAWAVGVTPKYAIGIWAGNADGEGRPGITGLSAAAPLLFDVLQLLPESSWFQKPYDELVEAEICTQSGMLAGLYCEHSSKKWIPAQGSKTAACTYHQRIFLDQNETYQVHNSCYDPTLMHSKNWFTLSPAMAFYYAKGHPEYKMLPPFLPNCDALPGEPMQFIFPRKNEDVILARDFDKERNDVIFRVAHTNPNTTLFWYLDEHFLGTTRTFHELPVQPDPGHYTLTVIDAEGNELKEQITVSAGI